MSYLPKNFKTGRFVVQAGDFRAYMRPPRPGGHSPFLVCSFRITSHPSNLHALCELQDRVGIGDIWTNPDKVGWSIATAEDMLQLASVLKEGATELSRGPVVDAWAYCVSLLPKVLRPQLAAQGKPYKSAEWTALRTSAASTLHQTKLKHPAVLTASNIPEGFENIWPSLGL